MDVLFSEIIFSTAHKAKGLEFDTVRLGEDFLQDISVQDGLGKFCLKGFFRIANLFARSDFPMMHLYKTLCFCESLIQSSRSQYEEV